MPERIYGTLPQSAIEICDEIERYGQREYDRGEEALRDELEGEYESMIGEIEDAARLKGFEEGYDEAKEVFQQEGIEEVKAQGYDLGWRAGQQHLEDAVNAVKRQRLGGHGC